MQNGVPPTQRLTQASRRIKLEDIHIHITDLKRLEATGRLTLFFENAEQCTEVDEERVMVAKKRVSSNLALLLQNRQARGQCTSWEEVENLLRNEFAVDLNLDQAWRELEAATYDWEDSPQAFTNRLICRYAVLEQKFSAEKLLNRDRLIKRKLWQGLPSTVKSRIESFTDTDYPLTQFLDCLEHERQFLLEAQKVPVFHIPEKGGKPTPPPEAEPRMTNQHFEKLQQQLDNLTQKMTKMIKPPTSFKCPRCRTDDHTRSNCPSPYCPYCRNDTHSLSNCTQRPPVGTCFDCRRPNCRRGKPGCPGRTEASS